VPAGRFLEVMQALVKEMNERGWEAALVPETFQEFTPRTLMWLQAGKWDDCEVCEAWLELGVEGLKAFTGGRQTFSGLQLVQPVGAVGCGDGGLYEKNCMRLRCGQQLVERLGAVVVREVWWPVEVCMEGLKHGGVAVAALQGLPGRRCRRMGGWAQWGMSSGVSSRTLVLRPRGINSVCRLSGIQLRGQSGCRCMCRLSS